jgi:hypothetical protein
VLSHTTRLKQLAAMLTGWATQAPTQEEAEGLREDAAACERGAAAIEENVRLLELLHDVFLNPYVGNPDVTRALMKRVSAALTPTQEATDGK